MSDDHAVHAMGGVQLSGSRLIQKKTFFFDLDGCLYFGNKPAKNAKQLLEQLRTDGKNIGFITNNSREVADEIADKLMNMGIKAYPEEIITATEYVGKYVLDQYGPVKVKVAGSMKLQKVLEDIGHTILVIDDKERAHTIIIGRDIQFNYLKLQRIVEDVLEGAGIISANPDMFHLGIGGKLVPETGSLVASIEAILDREIEYVGKPAPHLYLGAMRMYACDPEDSVMVGDNLKTDITGGNKAGMTTVWIQGEQVYDERAGSNCKPDYSVRDISELLLLYQDTRRLIAEN